MKTFLCFSFLFALSIYSAQAQIVPKGPAYDKAVKAFSAFNLNALKEALPALEKQYPANAYTYFFKGLVADRIDENINDAMRLYSMAIKGDATLTDPLFFRSYLFEEKGMYEKAMDDISHAIEIEKANVPSQYYMRRGEILAKLEKYSEAFENFKSGANCNPAHPKNYFGIVNMAGKAGKEDEAINILQAIAKQQPQSPDAWHAYADILLRTKKFKDADNAYDKAIAAYGDNSQPPVLNNAAIAALNVNNPAKAKAILERTVQKYTHNVDAYNSLADIAMSEQKYEDMYQWAQKALKADEKNPRANMYMAIAVKFTNRGEALSEEYAKKAKEYEAEGY